MRTVDQRASVPWETSRPSNAQVPDETHEIAMAIVALAVTPWRALTGHAASRGPSQQGLRGDPDERGRFAGPVPSARRRVWHAKTEAPSHPIEPVLELGLQALPDHGPGAPVGQPLELRHNAAVSAQQPSVRRPMQTLGAGNELASQRSQRHAMILLSERRWRPALGHTPEGWPERARRDNPQHQSHHARAVAERIVG